MFSGCWYSISDFCYFCFDFRCCDRRCSALVRLADDELFVGHSTWEPFSEMTRIVKFYDFPFKGVKARSLAFPSYPGAITSTDDFIITSAGLVLTETTIDIQDRFLFRERSNIREGEIMNLVLRTCD